MITKVMAMSETIKRKQLIPNFEVDLEEVQVDNESEKAFESNEKSGSENLVDENYSPKSKYLSEAEFSKRQMLKEKFSNELKTLVGKNVHLIVFELAGEEYAFDLAKSREVVLTPDISKLPHTPEYIKGVSEIRNTVIVVFNLAQKFNLEKAEEINGTYTMVMESNKFKAGVLVEKVPTTLIVPGGEIKSASGIVADATLNETYIKGIIKIDNRMIFFLDIDELIEGDRVSMMPEMA